jgi:ABC-2 type transport system permease protein
MTVAAITGALFPAFGESLGKVELPQGVGDLLGGGDFASITGWLNTEIASVYGPLVVAGRLAALALHLAFLALAFGALALALGGTTGRRAVAAGGSAAVAVAMYLVNGFAPVIDHAHWLKYLTLFHYYEGDDPLANGIDPGGLAVLAAVALALAAVAAAGFRHRDLRG